MNPLLFWDWIRQEAALIHADGCTGVSNMYGECCLQHDLEFYYGRSATDGYWHYGNREAEYWLTAKRITFEDANDHFKRCHFRQSKAGYLNVFAWWRYAVVRTKKGRSAWDAHRAREAAGV